MRVMKQLRAAAAALLLLAAAGCSNDGSPVNSPYESGAESRNTLYSAFVKRSPKYLDPASSYSNDETPYTYNVYETLYGYHYLKRPYELVPRAPRASIRPFTWTSRATRCLPTRRANRSRRACTTSSCAPACATRRIRPSLRNQTGLTRISPWRLLSCRTSTPSRIFR